MSGAAGSKLPIPRTASVSQSAPERRRDTPPDSAVPGRSWLIWTLVFAGALIGGYAALSILDRPASAAAPAPALAAAPAPALAAPPAPALAAPPAPTLPTAEATRAVVSAKAIATVRVAPPLTPVRAAKTDTAPHTARAARAVTDALTTATAPVPVVGSVVTQTSKAVVTPVLDTVSPVLDQADEAVERTGLPDLIAEAPGQLDPLPPNPTVPIPTVPSDVPPVTTPAQPVPSQADAPPPPRAAPPLGAATGPVQIGPTFLTGTPQSAPPTRHASAAGAPGPGTPPTAPTDPLAPEAVCQPGPRGPAGGDQLAAAAPDAVWTARLISHAAGRPDERPYAQRALVPLRRPG